VLKKKATVDGEPVTFDSLEAGQKIDVLQDVVTNVRGAPAKLPEPAPRAEGVSRSDAKQQELAAAIDYLQGEAHAGLSVAEADIEALSTARATAVQTALLASGELAPERVFLARSDKVTEKDGKVRLELALK
jgi:hypothetical protein